MPSVRLLQHPLSCAFPAMQADEFQELVNSISNIGVQNPITLYEGMVVDGWHRYLAASDYGIDCPSVELGDVDPRDFVIAQNKARRTLSASQRAAAVTAVYQWFAPNIGRPRGELSSPLGDKTAGNKFVLGAALAKTSADSRSAPGADLEKTTKELAAIAGVGTRTIERAKEVQSSAIGAVKDAVKTGEISVKAAAAIAKLPAKEQEEIHAKGPKAMREAAKHAPVVEPDDDEELDAILILSEENDRLNDRLAVVAMDATEEERNAAAITLSELRAENKTLVATLRAVTLARDSLMEEVAQLKRQCQMNMRELKKLRKD